MKWLLTALSASPVVGNVRCFFKPYSLVPDEYVGAAWSTQKLSDCSSLAGEGAPALFLDEGGLLHDLIGRSRLAAGAEQTTFGLRAVWRHPTVLVCRSAAKILFESQIIARGITRKLDALGLLDGRRVGVIGLGSVGADLVRHMQARGLQVAGTDRQAVFGDLASCTLPLDELLATSELVLGCTGTDVLRGIDHSRFGGRKIFASCSSSNIEFRALLEQLQVDPPYGNATGILGGTEITLLNGGYPVNFDRVREWEEFEEIILTRRLCFEGIAQASSLVGTRPRGVMLDPAVQLRVVTEWLDSVPDPHSLRVPSKLNENFFRSYSEGEYLMSAKPMYELHSTTPGAVAKMREHVEQYEVDVAGLPIVVLPDVWSPAYDWSSLFYVENFPDVRGRSFLEIGSGTGVISVFAGRNGASRVVAVDVNEAAVRNTALNLEKFRIDNSESFLSDGFSAIRETFDIITWNAPYHGSRPESMLERGCADEDYRDIRAFFREVITHLNPGGSVVFGFSESGDLPLIESLFHDAGLRVKRRLSDWRQDYNCLLFELVVAQARVG